MKRFRRIALMLLLPGLLFLAFGCSEEDPVVGSNGDDPDIGSILRGDISGPLSGTYTAYDTVTVPEGKILTLAPGTVIHFRPKSALNVEGEIIAQGDESNWITFTSLRSSPQRGDWNGIRLLGASDASIFEYVRVQYAAKYDLRTDTTRYYIPEDDQGRAVPEYQVYRGAITIKNCSPIIRRSIIELGGYDGINVIGNSQPTIEYNTIVQNAFNGIHVEPDWSLVNRDTGEVEDRLWEMYANLGQSIIHNNILVENDDAGVRLPQDMQLYEKGLIPEVMYNDIWNNASLAYVPPAWVSPSTPNHADVSTNIHVDPIFVDLEASDYALHPCSGVIDRGDPAADKDDDGTQADMGAIPLFQGRYDLSKRLVNDEVYNKLNLEDGMLYRVRCDIWVEDGDELTIGAGTILAFEGPYSLYLRGGVEISGTEGNEVVFTSAMAEPQSADWRQIVLDEVDEGSFIEHTIIEYASLDNRSSPSPDTLGALTVIACSPRLDNITIRDSYYAGLHCFDGANPAVDRLKVERVGMHGVICMLNSNPIFTRTQVNDASGYGFFLVNNSSPDISNLLMYNLGGSGFYIGDLSSPMINYTTVYGKRLEVIGEENGVERRISHGIHAENFAQPEVKNSIFAIYKNSGVLSEVSSNPVVQYTYFFTDVGVDMFVGPVETTSVYTDELLFVAPDEFDFTLPEGSPGKERDEFGGELGAYGNGGM